MGTQFPPKGAQQPLPTFRPMSIQAKRLDGLGCPLDLGPGYIVLDLDPVPQKGCIPQFSAHVCCGQSAGWIKMPLGTDISSAQATLCQMGTQLPHGKGHSRDPHFSRHAYCGQTVAYLSNC